MSDNNQVLPKGYGTPVVWLFDDAGNLLKVNDGTALRTYVKRFKYTYSEENDDTCEITLQFPDASMMDMPYLRPDVRIMVQWGYMVPGNDAVKSPKRKVAIRDISPSYGTDGIMMILHCTDLLAYLKTYKSDSTRKYSNPQAKVALDAVGRQEDNFLDWLVELGAGQFVPTVTVGNNTSTWDSQGNVQNFDYDREKGTYQKAIDNTAVPLKTYTEFHAAKVIKGKSLPFSNAIEDQLKIMGGDENGPYIADSTDDSLHIKQRNFDQPIFASFTFAKGTGELLSFKPQTSTRNVREGKAKTSNIDPLTKETKVEEIDFADEADNDKIKEERWHPEVPNKVVKQYLKTARETFKYNLINLENQKELPDLSYFYQTGKQKQFYKGTQMNPEDPPKAPYNYKKIPAQEIICLPAFIDFAEEFRVNVDASTRNQKNLLNYTLEKTQRKFTAGAKVIGDPTLIKGRIYGFYNLSKFDTGRWYAEEVTHELVQYSSYTTELQLLRKPKGIGFLKSSVTNKQTLNPETNKVETTKDDLKQEETFSFGNKDNTLVNEVNDFYKDKKGSLFEDMNFRYKTLKYEEELGLMGPKEKRPLSINEYNLLKFKPNNEDF